MDSAVIPVPAFAGPIETQPGLPSLEQSTFVTVTAPAGGTFAAGQVLDVSWDTQGPVDAHIVRLSQDGGVTFTNVSGTELSGAARSFSFVLPTPAAPAVSAVVRVAARLGGVRAAIGDSAPFTLAIDTAAPQVTVTFPNGGEQLGIGQPVTITWNSVDNVALASHKVLLSTDAGNSFREISPQLDGTARSYVWVPSASDASSQARVRVAARDLAGNRGTDDSNGLLSIGSALPAIDRLVPTQGFLNQNVRIEGRRFFNVRAVMFGGIDAPFTVVNDTAIDTSVPIVRTALQGLLQVTVSVQTDAGSASSPQPFTVTPLPMPRIDRIEPPVAAAGEPVTLFGVNLFPPATVTFSDGRSAPVIALSDTSLRTQVPAGARSGPVAVTTPGGSASIAFTVPMPALAPVIDGFDPPSGTAGTQITIFGRNFAGVNSFVPGMQRGVFFTGAVGDVRAQIVSASDTAVQAQVPAGAATGPVKLIADGGTAVSSANFVVPTAGSVALSVSPAQRSVASGASTSYMIALARSNFPGPVNLAVAGLPSGATGTFSPNPVAGDTAVLTITTAAGATTLGTRTLTISGMAGVVAVMPASATLAVGIAPSISGFDPMIGAAGTSVTIFGMALGQATAVRFNGVPASFIAANEGQLLATVPQGASDGPISVTTPFGAAVSAMLFDVPVTDAPVITGFSPQRGAPGTPVRLFGRNFFNLSFVDLAGALVDNPVVDASGTAIDFVVPFNANTGRFQVRTASGSAISEGIFILDSTVPPPPPPLPPPSGPTIAGFKPSRGAIGAPVTVVGSGFVAGRTSVSFNGVPAQASVISATQLNTVVPDGAITGPVSVTTPQGRAVSAASFLVTTTVRVRVPVAPDDGAL